MSAFEVTGYVVSIEYSSDAYGDDQDIYSPRMPTASGSFIIVYHGDETVSYIPAEGITRIDVAPYEYDVYGHLNKVHEGELWSDMYGNIFKVTGIEYVPHDTHYINLELVEKTEDEYQYVSNKRRVPLMTFFGEINETAHPAAIQPTVYVKVIDTNEGKDEEQG